MRRIFRVFVLVLLGLLAGLLLAEGAMRLYLDVLPGPRNPVYLADPEAGYRLNPEASRSDFPVNSLGFRDEEHAPRKAPGVRRVLGIGDSFVLGEVDLQHNFLKEAERELNSAEGPGRAGTEGRARDGSPGDSLRPAPLVLRGPARERPRTEVVLLGLGGYSPRNYLGVLRSIGTGLEPDYILLCFYTGNDVTGLVSEGKILHGQLYTTGSYNPVLDLLRRSRLFIFLERQAFFRLRRSRVAARSEAGAPAETASSDSAAAPPPENPSAPPPSRFYTILESNRLPLYLRMPPMSLELLWRKAEQYLVEFDQVCREKRIPWALVAIPDEIQVDPRLRRALLDRLGRQEETCDFGAPQRRLHDFTTRRSVPYLDLLPLFREAERPDSSLYYPEDTHWSRRGNRIAGAAVAEFLLREFERLESQRPAKGARRKAAAPARPDSVRRGESQSPPAEVD